MNVVDLWICGRLAGSSVAQIALGDDVVHEAWPFGQETSLDMFFGALLLLQAVQMHVRLSNLLINSHACLPCGVYLSSSNKPSLQEHTSQSDLHQDECPSLPNDTLHNIHVATLLLPTSLLPVMQLMAGN